MRNIGELLGLSKSAVWNYQQEHPEAMRWVGEQLELSTVPFLGAVTRKMAEIAMRGSVDHAKLFYQVSGRLKDQVEVKHTLIDLLTGGA